jgi:hypothetical protein
MKLSSVINAAWVSYIKTIFREAGKALGEGSTDLITHFGAVYMCHADSCNENFSLAATDDLN